MNRIPADQYRRWTPRAQQHAAALLSEAQEAAKRWRPWYCPDIDCDGRPHDTWAWPHCRSDQRPPEGDWFVWLLRSGRGGGKTRSGAEWIRKMTSYTGRVALVARTSADIRETLIEGHSGLLATAPPNNYPEWEPSKRRITWPNGCIGNCYSAEEPDRLRGPQHGASWVDEAAHFDLIEDVWSNLLLGLRLGKKPQICVTTTPKPTKWMRALIDDPLTVDVKTSTYANLDNLAPTFRKTVLEKYEGTRLGKQELYGEILEDVEGALWSVSMIESHRVERVPEDLERIVVSIDPAGTANRRSDETGIIAVGRQGKHLFVLEDRSGKYSPHGWASAAIRLAEYVSADAIVLETNFGGQMATETVRNIDDKIRIKTVHSRRGKKIRAEPVVGMYEQGRVHHVGLLELLETEQLSWVPGEGDSPNRVDALVHGAVELTGMSTPVQVGSPTKLRNRDDRIPGGINRGVLGRGPSYPTGHL